MLTGLGATFFLSIIIGLPIAICLGLSGLVALVVVWKYPLVLIPQRMFTGVDSFVLMAVPFFMLAGELMGSSGILNRLLRFADALVGRVRGGLAHVNILASMIFAGISGSAVADAGALGSALIPTMRKSYGVVFSSAVCAGAATIGPIIPPSIPMLVYAMVGNVSVAGLFIAGIIPGILMGLGMMVIAAIIAKQRNYPKREERLSFAEVRLRVWEAIPALFMPIFVLGGILWGIVTPTEAGAVAVLYAVLIGLFVTGDLKWSHFPPALLRAAVGTAVVFILIATSNVVSWVLSIGQVPLLLGNLVKSISDDPLVFLMLANILMLIVGCLLDNIAAMIMLAPILHPIALSYGVDPLHFGFIFVMNGVIGMLTPPFGIILFVVSAISRVPLMTLARAALPFVAWQIAVLLLCTYVPVVCMWLPTFFGYAR